MMTPLTVLRSHTVSVDAATFLPLAGGSDCDDSSSPMAPLPSTIGGDSLLLATGGGDGEVKLWDVARRRVAHEWAAHAALGVLALIPLRAQQHHHQRLLSHGRDGMLKVWDLAGGRSALAVSLQSAVSVGSFTFCRAVAHEGAASLLPPDGGDGDGAESAAAAAAVVPPTAAAALHPEWIIAPSDESGVLHLWDTRAPGVSRTLRLNVESSGDQSGLGMCMALRSFERGGGSGEALVAAAFEGGRLCVADIAAGRVAMKMDVAVHAASDALLSVDVGAGGLRAVCAGASRTLSFIAMNHDTFEARVEATIELPNRGVGRVLLRPCDQRVVATAGWDGRVRVYQWKRPKALAVLRAHEGAVHDVSFSPNGTLLASAGKDGHAMLWSVFPPNVTPRR